MAWILQHEMEARSTPYFEFDPHEQMPGVNTLFGWSSGFWINPVGQPSSAYQTSKKLVHDVFPLPGANGARQRFKDLVEEFEPGVHQFFPIALRDKQGIPSDDNFYMFNCMVSMDAVLVEETGLELKHPAGQPPEYYFEPIFARGEKVFVSKPQIQGHHLWMGFHLRPHGSWVFVSDEFYAELKKRKIKYLRAYPLEEVDIPWRAEEQVKPLLDWDATHPPEEWTYVSRHRRKILQERGRLEL